MLCNKENQNKYKLQMGALCTSKACQSKFCQNLYWENTEQKQEGNGPLDSRVMVMIYSSKWGLIFEIRSLNYAVIHVHVAKAPITNIKYWDVQLKSVKGCWSNIGLLLRVLWVVVCFHSRRLTICKHSCVRHISWAFCSAISSKQTMFTNS